MLKTLERTEKQVGEKKFQLFISENKIAHWIFVKASNDKYLTENSEQKCRNSLTTKIKNCRRCILCLVFTSTMSYGVMNT